MAKIVAVVTDLIFATKISSTGKALQANMQMVRSLPALASAIAGGDVSRLIVDLEASGIDPIEAIRSARANAPTLDIVAYVSHVQVDLAAAAKQAGATQVMPRSAFVGRLPQLLAGT